MLGTETTLIYFPQRVQLVTQEMVQHVQLVLLILSSHPGFLVHRALHVQLGSQLAELLLRQLALE